MRENETTKIYVENLLRDIKKKQKKNELTDKKFHYEKQLRCTRICLAQDLQSFTDYLTSIFTPLHHVFIFRNMLGVLPAFYLKLHQEENGFSPKPKMIERWMFKELNPFFFSKNPLKNCLKTCMRFSWKATTSKREGNQEHKNRLLLSHIQK